MPRACLYMRTCAPPSTVFSPGRLGYCATFSNPGVGVSNSTGDPRGRRKTPASGLLLGDQAYLAKRSCFFLKAAVAYIRYFRNISLAALGLLQTAAGLLACWIALMAV